MGLNCGCCGFPSYLFKPTQVPCFFNGNDLGIAIGSVVSKAADFRLDNRVMFSVGEAVRKMNILPDCPLILAIPLSVSKKGPSFDRK